MKISRNLIALYKYILKDKTEITHAAPNEDGEFFVVLSKMAADKERTYAFAVYLTGDK